MGKALEGRDWLPCCMHSLTDAILSVLEPSIGRGMRGFCVGDAWDKSELGAFLPWHFYVGENKISSCRTGVIHDCSLFTDEKTEAWQAEGNGARFLDRKRTQTLGS